MKEKQRTTLPVLTTTTGAVIVVVVLTIIVSSSIQLSSNALVVVSAFSISTTTTRMIRSRSVDGYSRVRLDSSSSSSNSNNSNKNQFKVSASSIEQNLVSDQEKAIVRVARASQPSIAFITSVLVPTSHQDRSHSTGNNSNSNINSSTTLPRNARPLGSGSAFVVDRRGYIVTNYHVIEMAYDLQQQQAYLQSLYRNVTSSLPSCPLFNNNNNSNNQPTLPVTAHIYVRIDSPTKYQKCRIVAVHPEVDLAIVQVMMEDNIRSTPGSFSSFQSLQFGRSSQLLVGQTVVAIGNPFGYDTTVTTGVVSALNREIRLSDTSRRRRRPMPTPNNHNNVVVRNCIQTDCAINPGNSGGPLLNLQGHVVGINTAIISTSGSNSGIGFAIASDMVQDLVQRDIQNDVVATQVWAGRRQRQRLPKRGTIGI